MQKKLPMTLALIFCALVTHAQETPPDANWESDPLDVLEPQKPEETPTEPSVPEFTEVPLPGKMETAPPPDPAMIESTPAMTNEVSPTAPEMNSFGSSEPDFSKESEFHRIYKTYNQEPTPVEAWEQAVGARSSEVYTVQKGDTLSGISTVFFGDQHFWPKIWSLNNNQILNPHEIDPGMGVQFYPGSMEDAPTLGLAALGPSTDVAAKSPAPNVSGVTMPVPKKRTPLLRKLPGSLPMHKVQDVAKTEIQLSLDLRRNSFPLAMEYLEFYMADNAVAGSGVITGTEMGMQTAGDYQYIFVRLDNGSEKNFVVQKNLTRVEDPRRKERFGQMVEIQGEIEILEKVNEQSNVYRAIVKKTIQPIEVGSFLTPGKLPMIDPTPGAVTSGVGAKIMGGQFDRKRTLFGSNSLVFLDAGSSQGIQEGQNLAIYADERIRNKNAGAVVNDRVIGKLKVVRVSANFATAYVTKATDDIAIGDYAGKMTEVAAFSGSDTENDSSTPSPSSPDSFDEDFDKAPDASDDVVPESGSDDGELEL